MKILPAKIELPRAPLVRRHQPVPGAWPKYRACLRWDFGFTCAFCFLHEADLTQHGIEGTGLLTIEHHLRREAASERADRYDNCFLACRYCNGARGRRPEVDAAGRRLLVPTKAAWGVRFGEEGGALRPRRHDADAAYTAEAYDLSDPRKVRMRLDREETITECLRVSETFLDMERRLLKLAEAADPSVRTTLVDSARELRVQITRARRQLARYGIVPADVGRACRCGHTREHCLPSYLDAQGIDLLA